MSGIPGVRMASAPEAGRPIGAEQRLLGEVLSVARRHLGMEVAFVSRVHGGRRVFEFVDTIEDFAPISVGESDLVEDTYCGRVLDGRVPVLVVDAGREPAVADIAATWDLPIGTHLSVPVHTGAGVYGTLCCFSRQVVHDVTSTDVATLRMFADIVGKHLQPVVERAREAAATQALVSEVLDDGGPQMALQPIVELTTGAVCGYEALARFPDHDGWGPQEWFDAAAGVGLGTALESAAVYAALRLLPRLAPEQSLAVNVSASALLSSASIPAMFTSQFAGRLVLEVTEHERISDLTRLNARLALVRAAGARIAADDAGSGYAGLEHILTLAPEVLKLDRALVTGVAADTARQAMCEAMVGFCRRTGTAIVAEGVETHEDLETLRRLGVTRAQGYLLGRPEIWEPADQGGRAPEATPQPTGSLTPALAGPQPGTHHAPPTARERRSALPDGPFAGSIATTLVRATADAWNKSIPPEALKLLAALVDRAQRHGGQHLELVCTASQTLRIELHDDGEGLSEILRGTRHPHTHLAAELDRHTVQWGSGRSYRWRGTMVWLEIPPRR